MASERVRRQIDRLLDEAEAAMAVEDWETVRARCKAALALDPEHEDARTYLEAARRAGSAPSPRTRPAHPTVLPADHIPTVFARGRYQVRRFLGEGGKKRVFLAHDALLDRDVAFALIRTEGLDATGRQRITHEAQAMARLSNHPNIVSVFDLGLEGSAPFIVSEYMSGGSVAGLVRDAEGPLPLARTLKVAIDICRGLEAAHAASVVHRDLKPGNVWLTEDGTAKIGDFGLAVALDRSRVTQMGSMIGTAAYMPPEQALGGDVTPQSDLYALGCMLYEMVTGVPPFAGDDPVAVISQQINNPPVAPSWKTEHCPADLEALILHCLQKVREGRPDSASAVREALEAIDPASDGVSRSGSDENPLDRLARGVFVGRERELGQLRSAFDQAFAGRGSVVMLAGEPGIGKTRAAQEAETYARMKGARVLWGRVHESAGAPPYWVWKQIGDAHARAVPPGELQRGLEATQIRELARIFPVLGDPGPVARDPQAAQFRLFDAYTAFLRATSEGAPLVVVLDDLHWADKASLLLLQHLSRELSRLRILVIGTYRDTELARTHPLSETLAELNRDAEFLRLPLRGLTRDEVEAYIRAVSNRRPARSLVARIFEETEGNPFFLSEVVNLMTQEGKLAADSVSDIAIPQGVREAIGHRLNRLSEDANELLTIAAVVGREFPFETLALLHPGDRTELVALIDEGIKARVIEELAEAGRYQFTHAQMQETLLAEISTTARVHLNGRIGGALEARYGDRADERAARLARYFFESATLTEEHAQKAVRYSKLAAEQAEAQAAWAEAARQYEHCLALISRDRGAFDESEPELLTALGACQRNAGAARAAWRSLMRAISLFRERGERAGLARASLLASASGMYAPQPRRRGLAREALEGLGDAHPYLEAQLHAFLSQGFTGGPPAERALHTERAAELAEEHEFADVRALLTKARGFAASATGDYDLAATLMDNAHRELNNCGLVTEAAECATFGTWFRVGSGYLDRAAQATESAIRYSRRYGLRLYEEMSVDLLAGIRLLRCEFQDYQALEGVRRGLVEEVTPFFGFLRAQRALATDDPGAARAALPSPEDVGGELVSLAMIHAVRTRVLLACGESEEARREFAALKETMHAWADSWEHRRGRWFGWAVGILDEALLELGDDDYLRALLDDWRQRPRQFFAVFTNAGALLHLFGCLALHLGEVDEAESAFREMLAVAEREKTPVVAGRCHAGLADVAAERGDICAANEHLNTALKLFEQHGAKRYLSGAIARKLELQGSTSADPRSSIDTLTTSLDAERPDLALATAPDGTVTILFSDIEGSTALNVELGDDRWMEVLAGHNRRVRECIAANRGFEVKTVGDAFMVAFRSARDALRCAIAIQTAFTEGDRIRVRIGLHTGEPVKDGDDFYGTHVTMASRIASSATGGEILVSSLLYALVAASREFTLDDGREISLKGLPGTHRVHAVAASAAQ